MVSLRFTAICLGICVAFSGHAQKKEIYHKGWIDFNKNGRKDIYEDPAQPVEKRVEDLLSQMTVEEKTCQLATLYGYGRVLRDSLPVEAWKQEIWKDGIGNIDEMLNGVGENLPECLTCFTLLATMRKQLMPCSVGLWKRPVWGFRWISVMKVSTG